MVPCVGASKCRKGYSKVDTTTATFDARQYKRAGYSSSVRICNEESLAPLTGWLDRFAAREGSDESMSDQQNLHLTHREFWDLATHPRLLDMLEEVVGPNILIMGSKLRWKAAHEAPDRVFPWHQDITYWRLSPPEAHSAWIALDDNTLENGCLWVVPGSHDQLVPHVASEAPNALRHDGVIPVDQVQVDLAAPVEMRAGEAMLFDARTVHSSRPNTSADRRCNFLVRYISPSIRSGRRWPSVLVRGHDWHGNFELLPRPF